MATIRTLSVPTLRVEPLYGQSSVRLMINYFLAVWPATTLKDHQNTIRAFAQVLRILPDSHLLLVGPGLTFENTELTNLLETTKTKNNVTLVGPRKDIPALMNGLDLHVLGSAFGEAFPNVLSEAMSCGTPCVATDVGDSATIIGETGRICPPRDCNALAEAILDIAPFWRDSMTFTSTPAITS